jgi:uncharacterized protein (DUF302 family)
MADLGNKIPKPVGQYSFLQRLKLLLSLNITFDAERSPMYLQNASDRRLFLKQSFALVSISSFLPFKSELFMNPKGVIIRESAFSVKETIDRLATFSEQNGVTVYARINQQSELRKAGIEIPPLEFIMFGNPKAGGRILSENPVAALDLPLKIIAWEDHEKKSWIAFNEASYISERYSLSETVFAVLNLDPLVTKAMNATR